MGNYEQLKQSVSDVIKTNGNQEITGSILQNVLLTIISSVGANATFAGIATPTTNPGTPDGPVFYLASESGVYTNFGGITLMDEVAILSNTNGSWVKSNTGIAISTKVSELENETDRNTQFVSKTGYSTYIRDYKDSSFRFYDLTKTINIEIKSLGGIYSIFYARQISHSQADFDFIVNSTSNDYKGSVSVREGYPYIGIWDTNLQDSNITVKQDDGIIIDIEKKTQDNLDKIRKIYSGEQSPYEISGSFRYYNIESRPLSISIKGTNDADKIYSIFYSKTMPYGSIENIEYIVREVYDDFNEIVTPKEGYPYIGIWITNLQDSDITVNTLSIIDELIDKVDKNTEDIDNIKSSLVHNRLYPSQLKSEMIKKVCQEMSIPIIDQNGMSGITTFNADLYLSDGTHPNGIGKEKSATLIASKIKQMLDVSNIDTPKMASVGDSITSNQVTNTADAVRQKINAVYLQERESDGSVNAGNVTTEFGNVACGWSTLTDYWVDGENKTTLRLLKSPNVNAQEEEYAYNVLSNQILRLAQHTTALGEQIIINATDGTNFTVPTEIGVGKGYTDDIPDVIYIASSTNDRWTREIIQKDDWEEVRTQKYNELKRDTIPSALRWAIISLQSLYPSAYIFVCTPLQKKYETRIAE